jgi:tryptophan 7-halogenase
LAAPIKNILVLGAGSAGLMAAIALKRKIPKLVVRVVRDPDIGVIGVGESTTPAFPNFLFDYLGISRSHFYAKAEPTWKMGIHFIWGPRSSFEYAFEFQLDVQLPDLPMPNGFYCDENFVTANVCGALMSRGKAFPRQPGNAGPAIPSWHAFHIENPKLVKFFESVAREIGVEFTDARISGAERGPSGIAAVVLEDGRKLEADFFIDASGFRSELLGRALEEPFVNFNRSLFCDRAVVGSWPRTSEPILPFTTAETMDAGWCWQIEHEQTINRGYVYCSDAISDDQARAEFMQKNPKAQPWDKVVKFKSGRYRRGWVDNVLAIGNACGFVEPIESTALMVVCGQCQALVEFLLHSELSLTPTMRDLYNRFAASTWDEIRDFLAFHYKFNSRLSTPFWKRCQMETDVSGAAELLEFYTENGPTGLCRHLLRDMGGSGNQFGIEGFLVMLVGNRVHYRRRREVTEAERKIWNRHQAEYDAIAQNGMEVKEALQFVKHPGWRWNAGK